MKLKLTRSSDELGKAPLAKLLYRYSVPAIFALVINALYNLVDRLYLAHYIPDVPVASAAEMAEVTNAVMAGLGFAMPYMQFVAAFGVLIGAGSAALLSIRMGAGDQDGAEKIVGQCVALKVLVFIFLPFLAYALMEPALKLCGAQGHALKFACTYLTIILLGSVFMHLSYGIAGLIRAEGKATMAMITMVVGAVSNVLLDPIFIFGWCGLPAMGIEGAAWATNLAMMISATVGIAYLSGKASPVRLRWKCISLYRKFFGPVLVVGLMPALTQMVSGIVHAIFIKGYEIWGGAETDLLISAVVIIQGVHTIVLEPACGIAQAAQPIIGYSYGAGKYARMMSCTMKATRYATIVSSVFFLVMMLGAPVISRAFIPRTTETAIVENNRPNATEAIAENAAEPRAVLEAADESAPLSREKLYDKTVWGMRVLAIGFPLFGIPLMLGTYYQSIGQAKAALIVGALQEFLLLVPLVIVLPYVFGGVNGVWYAQPISETLCGIICGYLLLRERRKIFRKIQAARHEHDSGPAKARTALAKA